MDLGKIVATIIKLITKSFMKIIKGAVKFIFNVKNLPYLLAGIIVIILIVLAIRYFKKRRAKTADEPADQPVLEEDKPKGLPKSALLDIWNIFFKRIPGEFRRSISLFQPVVVLGEAGVGKSVLIDNYTDWQGQARQFYPSYTQDPQLQLYLGSKLVVQEIPATLLNDTSQATRAALLKLWTPLFRKKAPRVVVALNAAELTSENKESLKKQAQTMRGKINLISHVRKKPVKVAIAITHMNQVEGLREFFDFLHANDIPLNLAADTQDALERLPDCLESYERYLSLALTTLPAADYLKIVSLLKNAPKLFETLASYWKTLQGPDPLSIPPEISMVCLTTDNEDDRIVSNPFQSELSLRDVEKFNPLLWHQVAAAALLTAGLFYLGFGLVYKYRLLAEIKEEIVAIESAPSQNYDDTYHQLFVDSSAGLGKNSLLTMLPDFFPDAEEQINQRLVDNIRNLYLLAKLQHLEVAEDTPETNTKTQYLLALIYSAKDNKLGKHILDNHVDDYSQVLNFSENLIQDYILHSSKTWDKRLNTARLKISKPYITVSGNKKPWLLFFNELERLIDKPFITAAQLDALHKKAEDLFKIIQASDRQDSSTKRIELLNEETSLNIKTALLSTISEKWKEQTAIRDLIQYILVKEINAPDDASLSSLRQFIQEAKATLALQEKQQKEFSFYFAGKSFSFAATDIERLMMRSRITLLIRHFIALNQQNLSMLFIHPDSAYSDIGLNEGNDGFLFFTGKAVVDGRFTRRAFNDEVKPALEELSEFVDLLPLRKAEKIRFSNFITKCVKAYASDYVAAWRNFYEEFGVQATSLAALRYTLTQIQLPHSQFQDFLVTVNENVTLEIGDTPYLRPFANRLRTFDSIRHLMKEDKGTFPELEKYKLIIGQLQTDIESTEPYAPDNGADPATFLKSRLSPLGRIALSIFRNEENSYLNLVGMWLKSAGIQARFHRLFLDPVYSAYGVGNAEVASVIEMEWAALVESTIGQMINKFPFYMQSDQSVSPAWLQSHIHMEGAFWNRFNQMIAPVCLKKNDTWVARSSPLGKISLPDDMLAAVNAVAGLTRTLWDAQGEPRQLTYSIKPGLLPAIQSQDAVVLLSYLKSGASTIYGFNQQPAWQDLTSEWWHHQAAAIGVEYTQRGETKKAYQTISIPETEWSLHRLLCKAEVAQKEKHQWRFSKLKASSASADVVFFIKPNPWALFNAHIWEKYRSAQQNGTKTVTAAGN